MIMPGVSFGWQCYEGSRYGTATYTFSKTNDLSRVLKTKATKLGLHSEIQRSKKNVVIYIYNIDKSTALDIIK